MSWFKRLCCWCCPASPIDPPSSGTPHNSRSHKPTKADLSKVNRSPPLSCEKDLPPPPPRVPKKEEGRLPPENNVGLQPSRTDHSGARNPHLRNALPPLSTSGIISGLNSDGHVNHEMASSQKPISRIPSTTDFNSPDGSFHDSAIGTFPPRLPSKRSSHYLPRQPPPEGQSDLAQYPKNTPTNATSRTTPTSVGHPPIPSGDGASQPRIYDAGLPTRVPSPRSTHSSDSEGELERPQEKDYKHRTTMQSDTVYTRGPLITTANTSRSSNRVVAHPETPLPKPSYPSNEVPSGHASLATPGDHQPSYVLHPAPSMRSNLGEGDPRSTPVPSTGVSHSERETSPPKATLDRQVQSREGKIVTISSPSQSTTPVDTVPYSAPPTSAGSTLASFRASSESDASSGLNNLASYSSAGLRGGEIRKRDLAFEAGRSKDRPETAQPQPLPAAPEEASLFSSERASSPSSAPESNGPIANSPAVPPRSIEYSSSQPRDTPDGAQGASQVATQTGTLNGGLATSGRPVKPVRDVDYHKKVDAAERPPTDHGTLATSTVPPPATSGATQFDAQSPLLSPPQSTGTPDLEVVTSEGRVEPAPTLAFPEGSPNISIGAMTAIQAGGNVSVSPTIVVNPREIMWPKGFLKHVAPNAMHISKAVRKIGTCDEGTRVKLLFKIAGWVHNQPPALGSGVLCMTGAAGSGKSSIALTIAHECALRRALAASFFFSSLDDTRNNCLRVISTIAYQLGLASPMLREAIFEAASSNPFVFNAALSVQATELIIEPFKRRGSDPMPSLILLDGIDECVEEEQGELLSVARRISEATSFRVFITGRPEVVIRRELEPNGLLNPLYHIRLSDDKEFDATDDIRRTLTTRLPKLTKQESPELREYIDAIVQASSGQYIYPATVIRFVEQGTLRGHSPKRRLASVFKWTRTPIAEDPGIVYVLRALDHLYKNILLAAISAFSEDPSNVGKDDQEIVLILRAFASLQITTVPRVESQSASIHDKILGLTEGTLNSAICDLRSLMRVREPNEAGKIVQFYHRTCLEFLQDERRAAKHGKGLYFPEDRVSSYVVKRLCQGFNLYESSGSSAIAAGGSFDMDEAAWVTCTSASLLGRALWLTADSRAIRTSLTRFGAAEGWDKLEKWIDLVKQSPQFESDGLLSDWKCYLNKLQQSRGSNSKLVSVSRKLVARIDAVDPCHIQTA